MSGTDLANLMSRSSTNHAPISDPLRWVDAGSASRFLANLRELRLGFQAAGDMRRKWLGQLVMSRLVFRIGTLAHYFLFLREVV